MELYEIDIIAEVSFRVTRKKYIFADNATQARKRISETEMLTQDDMRLTFKAWQSNQTIIPLKGIKNILKCIKPIKGQKRGHLTKTQTAVIKAMLLRGEKHARITLKQGGTWTLTSFLFTDINTATIIALRKKNLIIPMVDITTAEWDVQQAIGSMPLGEFSFVLNMKEVKKRKVYYEYIRTHQGTIP